MRLQFWVRWGLLAVTAIGFLAISACGGGEPEAGCEPDSNQGSRRGLDAGAGDAQKRDSRAASWRR